MDKTVFNFQEVDKFTDALIHNALKKDPKRIKKFLNDEGYKLRKTLRNRSKSEVNSKTRNYNKSWKKSKVYNRRTDDGYGVLVYNASRYAHIIEYGRRYKRKDGGETFLKGKHILERTIKEFESTYYQDCENLLDELAEGI